MQARIEQRDYMRRKDGSTDGKTDAVNSRMSSFVASQASTLSAKQVDPEAGLVGRLADSKATGWALRAMGFNLTSEVHTQPHIGAISRDAVGGGAPTPSQRQTGGRPVERKDSFGKRAGGLFSGFGSGRGKASPGAQRPPTTTEQQAPAAAGGRPLTKRSDSFSSRAKRLFGGGGSHRGEQPGDVTQKL